MRVEIPRVWLITGSFLLVEAITVALYNGAGDRDRATILFGGTVVAAAFALYVYLRGVEDKRTDAASRMIERWNAPERHELKAVIKYILDEKLDPSTLMRKTKGDTQIPEVVSTRIKVTSTLNFYEEMAISVKDKTVNEQKVFDFFSDMLDQTYLKLASFIENERSIDNAPRYYCEMEALIRRWREKR